MDKNITREQLADRGNEWMHQQFVTGQQHFKKIFSEVSTQDYLTLLLLNSNHGLNESKVYLKEIASDQELPMSDVSKMVQNLQERGFVYWNHDAQGSFITFSERGADAMKLQQEKVTDLMMKAVEAYGYDKFCQLLLMRHEFNEILEKILSEEN